MLNSQVVPSALIYCRYAVIRTVRQVILIVSIQDKWSAVYSVQTILLSLQSLLGGTIVWLNIVPSHAAWCAEPNNASPLNPDAANLWSAPDGEYMLYYSQRRGS